MAQLPTDVAVQHLIDSLRALGEPPAKGQTRRIDDLEVRLLRAVKRDRAGGPIPDGYRPRTVGDGRGRGPVVNVEDENGQDDVVAVTSVEFAVIARIDPTEEGRRRLKDRHNELTARAVDAAVEAVSAIQRTVGALDSIDDLIDASPPSPKTCDHCTGKRGQGANRPIYVRGTVGDRLERAVALCDSCYWFVNRTAAAGSRAGYLPSDEQIREHEQRGRWRIRVNDRKLQNAAGPGQT